MYLQLHVVRQIAMLTLMYIYINKGAKSKTIQSRITIHIKMQSLIKSHCKHMDGK